MRYKLDSGIVVDTANATGKWEDDTFWDGSNMIHKSTRDQWTWQTLFRSKKGRYYVEHASAWQGSVPWAEELSLKEAARWLLENGYSPNDAPEDVRKLMQEEVE